LRGDIDDGRSGLDRRGQRFQTFPLFDVEDHTLEVERGNVLLLATAEAGQGVFTYHGGSVVRELRALDMSFNALGLIGRSRFNTRGELREIASIGAQLRENRDLT
jgi:hypothetical protein